MKLITGTLMVLLGLGVLYLAFGLFALIGVGLVVWGVAIQGDM